MHAPRIIQTGFPAGVFQRHRGSIALVLSVIVWAWLCRDWPARLGFFADDWMILLHPVIGTARALRDIYNLVPTRPVSAPFIWLAQIIVDWSPVRSQCLNAIMLLVTALSVGTLAAALSSVARLDRQSVILGAAAAVTAFVVFPSNIGTFAWSVGMLAVMPATSLFCLGMSLVLLAEGSLSRLGFGLALVLASHLSYEAFYFQEVPVILAAAALGGKRPGRTFFWLLSVVLALNVGCLAFNRLVVGGIQKSFDWHFVDVFTYGYSHILDTFGHAVREHELLISRAAITAALFGTGCLLGLVGFFRSAIVLLAMVCGIIAGGLLYAMASYGLAAEGPPARVSIILATYCSIAFGLMSAAASRTIDQRRWLAAPFFVCAAVALAGLGLSARDRIDEWADIWTFELARLSRLPVMATAGDDNNRVYLAIEDRKSSYITPATAPWEVAGAVAWVSYMRSVDGNRPRRINDLWNTYPPVFRWFGTPENWFSRWDGYRFEVGPCPNHGAAYEVEGLEFWTWKTSTTELVKVESPWALDCK